MEFVDLAEQLRLLRPRVERRIARVLDHGKYIMGPEVEELEKELAERVGVSHCISCANGTDALQMGLMALGVGPGDAVFTSVFTFIATAEVISLLGATPVFVDIDPRTFNIAVDGLDEAIELVCKEGKLRPKAVIPVDLFGLPANYESIERIAAKHGISILEDAAQSLGSSLQGRMAGAFGQLAATSFFPAKPLGCFGDGGAIFTNDSDLASVLRSIRVHGKGGDKYDNVRLGVNSRLDTLQAAILLAKLEVFSEEIKARQGVADFYTQNLKETVTTPLIPPGCISAWAQYSILVDNRDLIQRELTEKSIPTNVYYPKPLHLQTAYQFMGLSEGKFPVAERTARSILSLPMHPYLKDSDASRVVEAVNAVAVRPYLANA